MRDLEAAVIEPEAAMHDEPRARHEPATACCRMSAEEHEVDRPPACDRGHLVWPVPAARRLASQHLDRDRDVLTDPGGGLRDRAGIQPDNGQQSGNVEDGGAGRTEPQGQPCRGRWADPGQHGRRLEQRAQRCRVLSDLVVLGRSRPIR